jgi:D-alanyl-D-alanine-carboxypeptidase/D-alanyl-D-alanine-endopeptidase
MLRGWSGAILLAACVGRASPASAQAPFPPDSALRVMLRDVVATGRATGIVVGLLDSSGGRHFFAEGRSDHDRLRLDEHTVMEIGSITKVFTATVLAEMARSEEVALHDPVSKFLPPTVRVPSRSGLPITLLDLATHYSGLPRLPDNMARGEPAGAYARYTVGKMYAFLSTYQLPRDPGSGYEYSNFGVGLLGHALARRAGATYEQLVNSRILRPLGMRETGITLTRSMRSRLAPGHDEFGDPARNWSLPALAGAGALRSTAADMLTFAAASVSARPGLLREAMRDAQVPRRAAAAGLTAIGGDSIGLNWLTSHRKMRAITWHNGGTGGYRTFLGLDRAGRRAVVVLTNSAGVGCDDIGFHLLDPGIPLLRPPVRLPVAKAYSVGGIGRALARYRELARAADSAWSFDPDQLNAVGYWLLEHGHVMDAVRIFRLNVETYPDESNPYDSLGEALLVQGDTVGSIESYERAVQLDPANRGALATVKSLRQATHQKATP